MTLPLRSQTVTRALLAKGMESSESHHTMFRRKVDGVTTLVTRVSHGTPEIGNELASLMARQCALHLREFVALVECELSRTDWDQLISERCSEGKNPLLRGR